MSTPSGEVVTEASPLLTRRSPATSSPPRDHPSPVPSLPNFRQIEGTHLYRSSCPERMSAEDVDKFVQVGIRSIIDLRHLKEVTEIRGRSESCLLLDRYYRSVRVDTRSHDLKLRDVVHSPGDAVVNTDVHRTHFHCRLHTSEYSWAVVSKATCCHKVLLGILYGVDLCCHTGHAPRAAGRILNEDGLAGQYCDTLAVCGQSVRSALMLLSQPEHCPAVVCCSYGKDRTGVIVALSLAVLGKSRQYIVDDYARSMTEMSRVSACMARNLDRYSLNNSFAASPPANMEAMLDFLTERYGSTEDYLDSIGFTSDDRRRMRETLLVDKSVIL